MRSSYRPFVPCGNCGATIQSERYVFRGKYPDNVAPEDIVSSSWGEPPRNVEKCPRCDRDVDTTSAYPYMPGFPSSFEPLKTAYRGFTPKREHNRKSFDDLMNQYLTDSGKTFEVCQGELNAADGFTWFKQRMFYRSATAFYRCLQLFLGYLTLNKHCYRTWADITAYYSRFYFIQSFLNLTLSTYMNVGKGRRAVIFFNGTEVVCVEQDKLSPLLKRQRSHDMWWSLMEALKSPDYPCENLDFILSKLVFNPERRQELNYDYDYVAGGFPELNWFDSGSWKQMQSHFMPRSRPDEDITNIDRFFGDCDPENCDPADFYADEAQIIWASLVGYLQLLSALEFPQKFVATETIVWLSHLHIGKEYPMMLQGIAQSTSEILKDDFDLAGFRDHPETFFRLG